MLWVSCPSRHGVRNISDDDSLVTVENPTIQPGGISNPSVVYVDGEEILKKSGVPLDAVIALGPKPQDPHDITQYKFTVASILKAFK